MIRFMLDTDTPDADYPASHLFATYADLIPTTAALQALHDKHPGAVLVAIDRGLGDPLGMASVCDLEPGAIWPPAKFGPWLKQKHAAGIEFPTSYCDRADLAAVDAAAGGLGHYRWVATLDGTAHIAGFTPGREPAAVQCFSSSMLGFHADGSLVFEDGWHPQPAGARVSALDVTLRFSDGTHKSAVIRL